MPRVLTQDLVPGMVTAEDVFSYSNQLVVARDTVLNDKTITKLEFYSILSIRVKDSTETTAVDEVFLPSYADETQPVPPPATEESSYSERIKASPEFKKFKANFEDSLDSVKSSLNDVVQRHAPIDEDALLSETSDLLAGNPSGIHIFDMLHNMRQYDDPTYAHCVNVSLICYVFGKWLKMTDEELRTLTMAGLLHDIGKLKIPEQIITKPDRLTDAEYATVKTHTIEGYNILKNQPLSDHIKNAALMHHEKFDGTGYPLGLKGNRIDRYACIVAIADVYDAMTSARVYRGPLCPFKVISIFESEGYSKYHPEYILTFLEYIVNTYINNRVRLSDGREGDVVMINKLDLAHPIVKCDGQFVDLSKDHSLSVEAIL